MSIRLAVLVISLCLVGTAAFADPSQLERGLGVVIDQSGMDRTAVIQPGIPTFIRIVTDDLGTDSLGSLMSVQFGVDVDPRLTVLSRFAAPEAFLAFNPAPDDWLIAFSDCVLSSTSPVTLATYIVMLPEGSTDTDLRIDVRHLVTNEPMAYIPCGPAPELLLHMYDAGGVLLNPSSPAVVHLSGSPDVLVEGRPFRLAWETAGSTSAELDGSPVALAGGSFPNPTTDTVYELVAFNGATSASRTFELSVIREPRINYFTAEYFDDGSGTQVRLAWNVEGANTVIVNGDPTVPIGTQVVPAVNPLAWGMEATNEWGSSFAAVNLDEPTGPPVITFFGANPPTFAPGAPVTLSYSILGADTADISGVGAVDPAGDNVVVFPIGTTAYTLSATNSSGTTTADVTATLASVNISAFFADPNPVFAGQSTTLQYATSNATSLDIQPDVGVVAGPNGQVVVTPPFDDTVYTLTVTNAESSASESVTVDLLLPSGSLSASNTAPFGGESFDLVATIQGATSASLEPGFGPIDPAGGTFSTSVEVATQFTLTMANPLGTSTRVVTVTPRTPAVSLTASNETPQPGESFELVATIEGADSATLEPGFGSIDPAGGIFVTSVQEETVFVLTAVNSAGTSHATLTITPPTPPLPTALLESSDTSVFGGESVDLTATLQNATSASIDPDVGPIDPAGGVFPVVVSQTTTYVLTATNDQGSVASAVTVTANPPQAVITATPVAPFPDTPVTLMADIVGATSATLEPGFGNIDPTGGAFVTLVPVETTFTLTASNPAGDTVRQITVSPRPPLVNTFEANPSPILHGESSTLSWNVDHADQVTIEPGGIVTTNLVGSVAVSPLNTTTYTLVATNSAGETQVSTTLSVQPFFIGSFVAMPTTIFQGQSSTLSWDVSGDVTVTLVGLGTVDPQGTLVVTPDFTTTYTLQATDGNTTREATATVNVMTLSPPTLHLSGDPQVPGGTLIPTPLVPIDFYILSENALGFINAFECSFNVPDPNNMYVLGIEILPLGLNVGQAEFGRQHIIAGLGECMVEPLVAVARVTVLFTYEFRNSGPVVLSASTPSSFSPPTPGYQSCQGELIPFEIGSSLFIDTFVSTANVPLAAQNVAGGVSLQWDASELPTTGEGRVLRAPLQGDFREIARLSAAEVLQGEFVDTEVPGGQIVRYKVLIDSNGTWVESAEAGVNTPGVPGASATRLLRNVPNPFNPSTEIRFELAQASDLALRIYDATGRQVWSATRAAYPAGPGSVIWNGLDDGGRPVASGIYVVQLVTDHSLDVRRITLLK